MCFLSAFDVSLICASLASGIAQVGINISLHYANDSFDLAVFFFIEKHCTGLYLIISHISYLIKICVNTAELHTYIEASYY